MQQVAKIRASKRIHLLLAWMASCRSATLACTHGPRRQSDSKPLREILNPEEETKPPPWKPAGWNPASGPKSRGPGGAGAGARTDSLRSMPPLTTSRPLRDTTVTFIPPAPRWQQQLAAGSSEATVWRCGRGEEEK